MAESNGEEKNNKSILIVDDEMFLREIYKDTFEMSGYNVDVATNGAEALKVLKEKSYDVILLDIMMPQIDGVNLLVILKEEEPIENLGKIVLTTNLEPDSLDSLQTLYAKYNGDPRELNVYEHVVKANIEPNELVSKVNELL